MTFARSRILPALAALLLGLAPHTARARHVVLVSAGKIGVGGHGMNYVAFSADGRMVASNGPATPDDTSTTLKVWTFPGGRFVRRLSVEGLLSRDWAYDAGEHAVIRVTDGAPIVSTDKKSEALFAFSPDSRLVAVAVPQSVSGSAVRIAALPGGGEISRFGAAQPFSLAFSPDRRILAAGHWDSIALWDIASRERIGMLRGVGRYVTSLSFSPDGSLLAAGTDLGQLLIWNVRKRRLLHRLHFDGLDVSDPAFSPDGKLVAVGIYGPGAVFLVDARRGKLLVRKQISDMSCGSVAFSPDGRYLIAPSTGGLVTWPYDVGGTIRVFRVLSHRRG